MAYVLLYWSVMAIGYFIGAKNRHRAEKFGFIGKVMLFCISVLVFFMGIRMGSNEEVIANLGTIGLQSLLITVLLLIGTVIFMTVTRRLLGFDKYGLLKGDATKVSGTAGFDGADDHANEKEKGSSNVMTWCIIIFVVIGLAVGYLLVLPKVSDMEHFNVIIGNLMTIGLSIMLFVIGIDMGLSGTVFSHLKNAGFRVLAFPVAVIIGTGVTGALISLLFPSLSLKEMLAICYGYGWYTFAPVSIAGEGYIIAGAISFMHNVIRELSGLILIPLLAKHIGYIEVTGLPGVAAMDVCMPIVERACRQDIVIYSFAVGMAECVAVPLLVPLIIGM